MNEYDLKKFVDEAIKEAEIAFQNNEVPVGAVLVKDGKIAAKSHNFSKTNKNRLAHAEMILLDEMIKKEGKETLDIIMAAILNEELEKIMTIFKDFKLNVERIDTIATSYGRLLKNIEYDDIAMINTGSYGSSATIYKEDALFIHDNIPVRVNEDANFSVSLALIDEVKVRILIKF